ncbi:MAG: DUF2889 domain-containing protein [Syntrophomonadaceae bacterium]
MASFHFHSSVKVDRISEQELKAECVVLSTNRESRGWLITDVQGLKISQAGWADYRKAGGSARSGNIPKLIGVEAFLDAGPHLKRALPSREQEPIRDLISECIRGLVQAETFFFRERGYLSAAQYDSYWEEMYLNGCYYYSHLDEVEKPWLDYVGYTQRSANLFNRVHSLVIHREPNGCYSLNASFIDSFHELGVRLGMDTDGIILLSEASYNRAPDKICWYNTRHLKKLLGLRLLDLSKKDLASLAGGAQGCNHLVDILYDACRAMAEFLAL